MTGWKALAPVAAIAVTGCLASKSDILLLQDEIRTMRAMQARSDTMRRAQTDSTLWLVQPESPSPDSIPVSKDNRVCRTASVLGSRI